MLDVPQISEVELKADVDTAGGPAIFGELVESPMLAGYSFSNAVAEQLEDIYLDTPDYNLSSHRGYVRLRRRGRTGDLRLTLRIGGQPPLSEAIAETTSPGKSLSAFVEMLRRHLPNLATPEVSRETAPLRVLESLGLDFVGRLIIDRRTRQSAPADQQPGVVLKLDRCVFDACTTPYYQVEIDFYDRRATRSAMHVFDYLTTIYNGRLRFSTASKADLVLGLRRLRGLRLR